MKKIIIGIFTIIFLCLVSMLVIQNNKLQYRDSLLDAIDESNGEYDENSIILQNIPKKKALKLQDMIGGSIREANDYEFAVISLPSSLTVSDIINDDTYLEYLEYMVIDYKVSVSELEEEPLEPEKTNYQVNDEYYPLQSYLEYARLGNAWTNSNKMGSNLTIAVIDTGIDTDHEAFSNRISELSYNATEDKVVKDYVLEDGSYDWSLIEDKQGHGTAVTGVIAASMDDLGITGILPKVNILTIKVESDENGNFYRSSDLVFGIYYAIECDVDIVNMSFSSLENIYSDVAKLAKDSDVTLVASSGNGSSSELVYPAADNNVIGVGALALDSYELAEYSNFGENNDIVAPGTVYTTIKDNKYGVMSGTSFSAPIVSAAIGLLKSERKCENDYIVEKLYASSIDLGALGPDFYYGYGALDINAFICERTNYVTFDYLTDEIEETKQLIISGHTLQNMPEPERNYAVFGGWYYDINLTEEVNLYEDIFTQNITLYAKWENEDDAIPYTYIEKDDGSIEITGYTGHRKYITIPDMIDKKKVTSIGIKAFENETKLRSIILPKDLEVIKQNAFANCANLTSIEIPSKVKEIQESAFVNCHRLVNISFDVNGDLEVIGNYAFNNCASLMRIDLPRNLKKINGSSFAGTKALKSINISPNNQTFKTQNGVLFDITGSLLIAYPSGLNTDYNIPTTVKKIGDYAFYQTKLTSISLEGIERIGNNAFYDSKLKEVAIPDSLIELGQRAFARSLELEKVDLGSNIDAINSETFRFCESLTDIIIPNNIKQIGSKAFSESGLETISFAEDSNLIKIGDIAFSQTHLETISLPKSLVYIGKSAFEKNYQLKEVIFDNDANLSVIEESAFKDNIVLKTIDLPNSLVQIENYAFINSGLEGSINLGANISQLGVGVFADCDNLIAINIDLKNEHYYSELGIIYNKAGNILIQYPAGKIDSEYQIKDNVEIISEAAFLGAANLNVITFGNDILEIGNKAFYDCNNIRQYNFNDKLETIGESAFAYNDALTMLMMPNSVINVKRYAFYRADNLSIITFQSGSNLSRISYGAFAYSGLSSFTVPAKVSSIAQYAFYGCDNLESILFMENSELTHLSAYLFAGCDNLRIIDFSNGSKLTNIQAHAFDGMESLREIRFGDAKITNIDNYAFRGCSGLTKLSLPNTLENIGRYAFFGCENLSTLTIPESVNYIGRYAFNQTNNIHLYFEREVLPDVQENWDYGIAGYYLGTTEVISNNDFEYAISKEGNISIIKYLGTNPVVNLNTLDLGGNITTIGGYAFNGTNISEIVLPETLINISHYAFADTNITSIIIPDKVEYIGKYAFYNSDIEEVSISMDSSLSRIEQYAFSKLDNLESIYLPKDLQVLGSNAFALSNITAVSFADDIRLNEISTSAFMGTKLKEITIPNSITTISDSAFRDCLQLAKVNFGTNISEIRSNAFYNTALVKVDIAASVTYIGEFAFTGIKTLEMIEVSEDNKYYSSLDGVLYDKKQTKIIVYPANKEGEHTLLDTVETIGYGAFENSLITKIHFSTNANILSIGNRAFFEAKNLKEITIPASVVSIDYYAFAYCDSLTKVVFGEGSQLSGIYEGAFYGCSSLNNILLPDSVKEIGDYAFYGCESLNSLPITDNTNLLIVGDYAFAYTNVKSFNSPNSLTDLGKYAFMGCPLEEVTIGNANSLHMYIGYGVFQDCNKLEKVTLPFIGSYLNDLDNMRFSYFFGINVPNSLKEVIILEGMHTLGCNAFSGCRNIEVIKLPQSITTVKEYALDNLDSIKTMYLPNGFDGPISGNQYFDTLVDVDLYFLGTIEDWLDLEFVTGGIGSINLYCLNEDNEFYKVTEVVIPGNISEIGFASFSGVKSLEKVIISEGVTTIGSQAFSSCANLSEVVLPNSLKEIGSSAFSNCINLSEVVLPDDLNSIGSSAFYGCQSLTKIEIPNSITEIGSSAFAMCNNLSSIKLSDHLTSIGSSAFWNCSISEITLPNSLQMLSGGTFDGCERLESIYYNGAIDDWLKIKFQSSESITIDYYEKTAIYFKNNDEWIKPYDIIIPEGVTEIGAYQFAGFALINSIVLPSTLEKIGLEAFKGCKVNTIYNNSELPIMIGEFANGQIAANTNFIYLKDGSVISGNESINYVFDQNGFVFTYDDTGYTLVGYNGKDTEITLPLTINDNSYAICFNNSLVEKIIIPEGIKTLSPKAFRDSQAIEYVLPTTLETIGDYAFLDSNLSSIIIPENVTSIGRWAFSGCESLSTITIPEKITQISDYCFEDCINLKTVNVLGNISYLGARAFRNTLIKEWILPVEISIGYLPFEGCDNLEKIYYLGDEADWFTHSYVDNNHNHPFGNASLYMKDSNDTWHCVESMVCPDGITELPLGSTNLFKNIKSFTLPSSITSLPSISKIDALYYRGTIVDWINIKFYDKDLDTKTIYVLDENDEYIEIIDLTILEGITDIYDYTFKGFSKLKTVKLPKTLNSISALAFDGCDNLETITIDEAHPSYQIEDNIVYNKDFTVLKLSFNDSEKIIVKDSVVSIESHAFSNHKNLKSIELPISLSSLGSYVFTNCAALTHVTIPEGVTEIGTNVFTNCSNLESISLPSTLETLGGVIINDCDKITNLTIPSGVKNITYPVISNCDNINNLIFTGITTIDSTSGTGLVEDSKVENLYLPKSLEMINNNLFSYYSLIENIYFDGTLNDWIGISFDYSPFTSLPHFYSRDANGNYEELVNLVIPDGVTIVPMDAFSGILSIKTVEMPDTVIQMGSFQNCINLESIKLSNSLEAIGNFAFSGCNSLKEIIIPEGVKTLGDYAFSMNLEKITLPKTLETSGYYCFAVNSYIDSVYYNGTIEDWCKISFEKDNSNPLFSANHFYCTNEKSEYYEVTSLQIPETITQIGDNQFYGYHGLKSIVLPSTLESIGINAFAEMGESLAVLVNNSALDINFGNIDTDYKMNFVQYIIDNDGTGLGRYSEKSIITDGKYIYESDESGYKLTYYYGNEKVVTLPTDINGYNYTLDLVADFIEKIIIPENVILGEKMLSNSRTLTSIVLSKGIKEIPEWGFYGQKLNELYLPSSINIIEGAAFERAKIQNLFFDGTLDEWIAKTYESNPIAAAANFYVKNANDEWELIEDLVIPAGVTSIEGQFTGYKGLKSITFPEGMLEIGKSAFTGCENLTEITLSSSLKIINRHAFSNCLALERINTNGSLEMVDLDAFLNTKYYQDPNNWNDGILVVGNYIAEISDNIKSLTIKSDYTGVKNESIDSNTLEEIIIDNSNIKFRINAPNLKTLIIDSIADIYRLTSIFDELPYALEQVIIRTNNINVTSYYFNNITNIRIYLDIYEEDVLWGHDAMHEGWDNGNQVYYKGEWINVNFFDYKKDLITSDYYLHSEVIRRPYVEFIDDEFEYEFIGWDMDGDLIQDFIPATSLVNINAYAITQETVKHYSLNYYGKNNELLYTYSLPYGSNIIIPDNPTLKGYSFVEWINFDENIKINSDLDIYSRWVHNGEHDYSIVEVIDPTCTEKGYTKNICSICDEWYASNYQDKLSHQYTKQTIPATCIDKGYDLFTCSLCGESYKDNFVSELGHKFDEWIISIPATCITDGLQESTCSRCFELKTEVIQALGHDYQEEIITSPTCSQTGLAKLTCQMCGNEVETELEIINHNYTKKYVTKSILKWLIELILNIFFGYEGDKGYYYQCSECKHILLNSESKDSSSVQEACMHEECGWVVIANPTCIDDGYSVYQCSKCNEIFELVANPTPYGSHDIIHHEALNPTCENIGHNAYETCRRCNYTTYEEIEALGHEEVIDQKVDATCENTGLTEGSHCLRCNTVLREQEIVSALGHDKVMHEALNPTCENIGHNAYETCRRCNYTTYEEIEALGHEEVIDQKVDATCVKTGLTEGSHCLRCNKVLREQEIVSALGHDKVMHEALNPTCENVGHKAYETCRRCDYTTYEILAQLGHNYETIATEATCLEKGYLTHICTRCKDTYISDYKPELGHNIVIDFAVSSTCEEIGLTEGSHCSRCNEILIKQEIIPVLGHDYHETIINPTCEENGYTKQECSRCNDIILTDYKPALGHNVVIDAAISATCTEAGLTEGSHCSRCDETLVQQESVLPLGHNLIIHEKLYPTCLEKGYEAYEECTRCDYTTYDELPALDHIAQLDSKVDPTCTSNGLTEGSHCSRCNEVLIKQEIIPSLGHIEVVDPSKDATCIESGLTEGSHCSRCNEVLMKQEIIPALSHDYIEHEKVDASCTEAGHEAYVECRRCDYSTYVEIKALGHVYDHNCDVSCNTCGDIRKITHTCIAIDSHDEIYHYCSVCKEMHTPNCIDWKLVSEEDGIKTYEGQCIDCGLTVTKQEIEPEKSGCNGGCGGSITSSILGLISLAGVAIYLSKRKENK